MSRYTCISNLIYVLIGWVGTLVLPQKSARQNAISILTPDLACLTLRRRGMNPQL